MQGKYKVFISFKSTDEYGNPTWDSIMGAKLQNALESKGIKTFFSATSVKEDAGYDYQEMIYKALEEADILVAMCSNADYLKTGWIKEEISSFRQDMLNENKDPFTSGIYVLRQEHVKDSDFSLAMRRSQMYTDLDTMVDVIVRRCASGGAVQQGFSDETTAIGINETAIDFSEGFKSSFKSESYREGTILAGKYMVEEIIGEGGMGVVYAVKDINLGKKLALKCVSNQFGVDYRKLARKEAEILMEIDAPFVPAVYDVFELNDSETAIVMSLIEGVSLNDNVRCEISLSEDEVMEVARQLCSILDVLHSHSPKIIHRDIKPGNLIKLNDGNIMLIDFGSARHYSENKSVDTVLIGSRGYASPEQYGGLGQTDERTDIFSMGMTLLALIMGQAPNKLNIDMNSVYDVVKPKSEKLACIIERCTELDMGNRYQSAKEVLWNLENPEQIIRQPRKIYAAQEKKYNIHISPSNMDITAALLSDDSIPFEVIDPSFNSSSFDEYSKSAGSGQTLDELIEKTGVDTVGPVTEQKAPVKIEKQMDIGTPSAFPVFEMPIKKAENEMVGKICISNAQLRNGMMYVHVYLAERSQALMLNKIVSDHLDYEMISDMGLLEIKTDKAVTVGVECKKILFDGPKTEINISGIMYFCFRSRYPLEDIDKAKIKVNISTYDNEIIQSAIKLECIKKKHRKN